MKYKTIAIPEEAHKALIEHCQKTGLKAGILAGKIIETFLKKKEKKNGAKRN